MAEDVKRITGVDVAGGTNNFLAERVRHIEKRHEALGDADQSMADTDDIARAAYALNNYDNVELSPDRNRRFKKKDGSLADILLFKKAVDGVYAVVEAVPDSKKRRLFVVSSWIENNKKGARRGSDAGNFPPRADVQNVVGVPSETESFVLPDAGTNPPQANVRNGNYSTSVPDNTSVAGASSDVNNLSSASRVWIEPEMPRGTGDSSPKVRDIRNIIERVTGMPVREGQVRKRNVMGYIDHLHEVIRSKSPNDIATMLHEFGHAMDRRFKISERNGRAYQELNDFILILPCVVNSQPYLNLRLSLQAVM